MEEEKLQPGDTVICINDLPRPGSKRVIPIKRDKEYVIQYTTMDNGCLHIALRGIFSSSPTCTEAGKGLSVRYHWFHPSRFKKV
jgi:hypothetical protein